MMQKKLTMNRDEWEEFSHAVSSEIALAQDKFPAFPTDPIHATAIVGEEAGESIQASLQAVYEDKGIDRIKEELIQTAAMCARAFTMLNREEADANANPEP